MDDSHVPIEIEILSSLLDQIENGSLRMALALAIAGLLRALREG